MATAPEIDPTPLECPECGEPVPPIGKQTPAMALGNHRWKAHQVKGKKKTTGPGRKAAKPAKAKTADAESVTPLAVVRNITDPLEGGKGAPSVGQLTSALGRAYGYLMLVRVSRLAEKDPRLTDDQRVAVIDQLAPAADTCEAVASPLARVLARSNLNKTAGRAIVDNIDYADALVALVETERALARYSREIKAVVAGQASGQVATLVTAPAPAGPAVPLGSGASDYYAGGDGPRSPAPVEGVVVDAAMVAAQMGRDLGPLPEDVNMGTAQPVPPSMEVTQ